MTKPAFLVAAPSSNSGKTTFTLGLLRLLKNKGLEVQPFKCGPDYLDTIHHSRAARRTSINLDGYMSSKKHLEHLLGKYSSSADVAIAEGVMGLFDGAERMNGSSAEISLWLGLPVVLVMDARAMAYSAAPIIYGFKNFHPDLNLVGVVFNFVKSESHYNFLKAACEDVGVEALGYVPPNSELNIPSRHLGLDTQRKAEYESLFEKAAAHIEKTVDIDRLLAVTQVELPTPEVTLVKRDKKSSFRIVIAQDAAFYFFYKENLDAFEELGEVTFFSPLKDEKLPAADLVYLAGGYPELYVKELAANKTMLASVRAFCENGGKLLAECGGLMYMGKEIEDGEGEKHEMADVFGFSTSMKKPKLHLGYREFKVGDLEIKGHEFHYSALENGNKEELIGSVKNARGSEVENSFYRKINAIATYQHSYWGEQRNFIERLFGVEDE
ncbi:cobyrinate a,c-diamide synthase [Flammeovirgaceae bacterium SG7u.111]|nr:cobyrinate a,c-diamide synthase [Flammeovirgaceae bacterium SG7u.132]WPO38698.1 cobyrinate a,c-diamide synthase [Flammeovirgaceae bacterium SG7u.111]